MTAHLVNAILRALPAKGVAMGVGALTKLTDTEPAEVTATICKLVSRRLVERVRPGHYRLTALGETARDAGEQIAVGRPKGCKDTGIRKPNTDTLRARLWRMLRRRGKASLPELLELARNGTESDDPRDGQRYMAALAAAGLVVRMPRKGPDGEYRYSLVNDPGPLPPVYRRGRRQVYDPNTGRVIDIDESEAVS